MNSYASSMVLMRVVELAQDFRCTHAWPAGFAFAVPLGADRPAARLVVLEILPPRDPAEDHRLGDPPLLGPHGEVDVRDHEADEADAREPVRHVGEAPGDVAQDSTDCA